MNIKLIKKGILAVYVFSLISMIPIPDAHASHGTHGNGMQSGNSYACSACEYEEHACYHRDLSYYVPENQQKEKPSAKSCFNVENENLQAHLGNNSSAQQRNILSKSSSLEFLESVFLRL